MKSRDQIEEIKDMNELELNEKYRGLMKELFNLRFQGATAQLSSPARFTQVRREIARLKTIAKQRSIRIR
jgi:large subunit ribosomal protein L29